jgi:hypothetical protein
VYSSTHTVLAEPPTPLRSPPHLGSYTRALLVSQDRRHLFVTSSFTLSHRLNTELGSPKFIWAPAYSCTHWLRPRNPPPLFLGSYTRALLVSQDLFVTPCFTMSKSFFRPPGAINLSRLISRKTRDMQAMRDIPYLAANCNRSRQGRGLAG